MRTGAFARTALAVTATALLSLVSPGAAVAQPHGSVDQATRMHDFDADGSSDVVAPGRDGNLHLYRGNGSSSWASHRVLGGGWDRYDNVRLVGDFYGNGPGVNGVLARDRANGDLWLHRTNGSGGWAVYGPSRIGHGWSGFRQIFSPGDWTGDGPQDLLAIRRSDGTLWLYPGSATAGFGAPRQIGHGWGGYDSLMPTSDFDGDGRLDFLARNTATGALHLFENDGRGGFGPTRVVGSGWNGLTALVTTGDWTGDRAVDVLARTSAGDLVLYRGNPRVSGGWIAPYPRVGTGWNSIVLDTSAR